MIKKLKSSLTAKIFLLTALLLTVCCIATYGFIAWLLPKTYPNQIDLSSAELYAYEAAQELRQTNIEVYPYQVEALQETYRDQLGDSLELHIFDDNDFEISLYDISEQTGKMFSDYEADKRTQTYSFTFLDNSSKYTLFFEDSSRAVNQAIEALDRVFPYLIITVLLIAFFTSFVYSKYITAPIKKINRTSQKMAILDFDVKCDTHRTDELGGVSDNLNLLAEKLSTTLAELKKANAKLVDDFAREKQMEKQRTELFSAVSHELKTPITIAKGQLQGMIGEVGRYKDRNTYLVKSLEVINSMETMVQELLTISRMDTPGFACRYKQLDLVSLIRHCLTSQEDIFIQKDIALSCDLPESATYCGDQQLLKRAFDNLIHNALSYSPVGSRIIVAVNRSKSKIEFSIENTGVHIAPEELPKLFEAFYRPDQSRNRQTGGSGLGLYIVKRVLDLHHAQYALENSMDGIIFTAQF